MQQKRILGLDPGLAIIGFGGIHCPSPDSYETPLAAPSASLKRTTKPESVQLIECGVIETAAKTPIGDRLCTIYQDLHEVLNELKPDLVAIEKLFFYRMSTTIPVAQARGILLLVLAQHQLPYVEYTPAQIKQALTGYGNADKQEVQAAVTRELNLEAVPKPDDVADALAVAVTAWLHL